MMSTKAAYDALTALITIYALAEVQGVPPPESNSDEFIAVLELAKQALPGEYESRVKDLVQQP